MDISEFMHEQEMIVQYSGVTQIKLLHGEPLTVDEARYADLGYRIDPFTRVQRIRQYAAALVVPDAPKRLPVTRKGLVRLAIAYEAAQNDILTEE